MQAQLVLHHLLPPLLRQPRVRSAPWPATAFDVALAFLSPVFLSPVCLSPVFLDLARKSGLPDLRAILRNPGKPGFTMLRNPGKPGFRRTSPWSDGLPPSHSPSPCRWLPLTRRLGRTGTQRDR